MKEPYGIQDDDAVARDAYSTTCSFITQLAYQALTRAPVLYRLPKNSNFPSWCRPLYYGSLFPRHDKRGGERERPTARHHAAGPRKNGQEQQHLSSIHRFLPLPPLALMVTTSTLLPRKQGETNNRGGRVHHAYASPSTKGQLTS